MVGTNYAIPNTSAVSECIYEFLIKETDYPQELWTRWRLQYDEPTLYGNVQLRVRIHVLFFCVEIHLGTLDSAKVIHITPPV